MTKQNALRTQDDGRGDEISQLTGIDFTDTVSMTRQEFKDEADVNILLRKYGANQQLREGATNAEIDYNMDLQQAFAAIDSARSANMAVPDELRNKYPDWRSLLNGAENGNYQRDLIELQNKKDALREKKDAAKAEEQAVKDIKARTRAETQIKREAEDASQK